MTKTPTVDIDKTRRRASKWMLAATALILCCLAGFLMPVTSSNSTGSTPAPPKAAGQERRCSPSPEMLEQAAQAQRLRDLETSLKSVKASLEVKFSKDLYSQYLELSEQIESLRRQLYGQPSARPMQLSGITPNVTQCISGALAGGDPTFNRPLTGTSCSLSTVGTAVFYDVYELTKTCAGTVTVSLAGSAAAGCGAAASHDSFLVIYQSPTGTTGAFNPASPCTNFIQAADDTIGNDPQFTTTASLVAGTYYVVVTSFSNATTGTYDLFVDDGCAGGGGGGDCDPCTPVTNLFQDPGLETSNAGTGANAFWASTSTAFGSSICSGALCGTGGGTAVPRTGTFFAWFGGVFPAAAETGTLSQTVTIPTGTTATLTFFLRIGDVNTPFTDTLNVRVDGNPVGATITEPATAEATYTQRTYDLTAFANGAAHNIELRYVSPDGQSNFTVDDLQLQITCPPCDNGDTCTNPNVNLLVADTTNSRIQAFDGTDWLAPLMTTGTSVGQVKNPKGVTQTSDGVNIYVADTGNNRIQKSTDSGATWALLPNTTVAPVGFKLPAGVAVQPDDPNIVYVADTGNNRVLASSDGGATWTLLAGVGSAPNQVRGPEGLVVDCDGNLWIADTLNNRIVAYAGVGDTSAPVTPGTGVVIAGLGSAPNQVRAPKAVTVDVTTGDLFVADTSNNRITHYINGPVLAPVPLADASLVAPSGSALGQVRSPAGITVSGDAMVMNGRPTKVAASGVIHLVVGDTMNNRIQMAELTGSTVGAFTLTTGTLPGQTATIGSAVGQFRTPTGVR